MTITIIALVITLLFSAFFSGMEIAFVSCDRLRAEVDKGKNSPAQKALSHFRRHPNNFISTMLVGNNIALVVYGILFAKCFDAILFSNLNAGERVTADTLLSTVVVLFTSEFLPKTIFRNNSNTLLNIFALPAFLCYVVLYPISRFTTNLSRAILRIFGIKMTREKHDKGFTKVDLGHFVEVNIKQTCNTEGVEEETKLFHNVLDFSDTKVRDCMVPRTEAVGVDIDNCSNEELKGRFIETGFSKILVYKNDIDHIIGYIHSSEMFRDSTQWREHIREVNYVPEVMAAKRLMHILLQQKRSLAVVVDEFGGTCGIITLEDIVEDIFGEIEDEHDKNKYIAIQTGDNEYILSARLEISKVNEDLGLNLPERNDEYITVGGLILYEYQSFPKLNEEIKIGSFVFKVVKNTTTKIEVVKLTIAEK